MKLFKSFVLLLGLLLIMPSCYQKQQLDYSNWWTREEDEDLPSEDLKGLMIMSSNVRYYSARNKAQDPDVGERDWEVRKTGYFQMVNTMQPTVLGLQEAEMNQVQDIISSCEGYSFKGVGRQDGDQKGESTSILYKTNLIQVEEWGTVWHSATPDVAGSYFPEMTDGQCRTSTWAILTVKETGRKFFYLNTHTSLEADAQKKEIDVILNTVASKCPAGLPVVLSADWNLEENDPIMAPVLAAYSSARQTAAETDNYVTFHWWGNKNTISQNKHLDHIFYSGFESCLRFRTLNMKWKNMWISDHHPVYAIMQFKTGSTEKPKPVADFDLPQNPVMDEVIKFTDKSTAEEGIELWEWNIGGILSSQQNPEVVFNTFGENIPVTLTVTDHYGQKATATKTFSVARSEGHDLFIEWKVLYDNTTDVDKGTAVADWTAPAVSTDGSKIYVASSGYNLVGFNPDGSTFGSYDIGQREPLVSDLDIQTPTPSIDSQGNVYIPVQYTYGDTGHGGLYSIQADLTAENWYHDTGTYSQYRCTIPAIVGDYVAVVLTNCGNDLERNTAVFRRSNGTLVQVLECDKGSWGGMAVGRKGEIIYSTNRGGDRQGRVPSTTTSGGYHVAVVDGSLGNWKTSDNSDSGRKTNLLGMRHSDGNGYLTKAGQPAVGTDNCVYVSATSDNENMICAKYDLDSYVFGAEPKPIWKVELETHSTTHSTADVLGLGCVLDPDGNAYFRSADKVFRLNSRDGELAWSITTEGDYNTGVPAIDSMGYLYVVDYGGNKLLKLSSADGKLISSIDLDNPRTSPTIGPDGTIYVTGSNSSGAVLYKITCPKTTAPGSNWSQLGGNPQKTCSAMQQ